MIKKVVKKIIGVFRGGAHRKTTSFNVARSAKLHPELEINAGHLTIGEHTYIGGPGRISSLPDTKVTIGKYTSIASGLQAIGALHNSYIANYPLSNFFPKEDHPGLNHGTSRGDITIGSDVWIGVNVIVLSGVNIGDGAVVGAGSVVTRDVPPYSVVAGAPATVRKMRFSDEDITKLLAARWWDWETERVLKNVPLFYDRNLSVDEFLDRSMPRAGS